MSKSKTSNSHPESNGYAAGSELGKKTEYIDQYSPELLHSIPRNNYRSTISSSHSQLAEDFLSKGIDVWYAYELSYLQPNGLPRSFVLRVSIPANSPNIIESKSLKLYLNSFSQTVFQSSDVLLDVLHSDLNAKIGASVECELFEVGVSQTFEELGLQCVEGGLDAAQFEKVELDQLDVDCNSYEPDAGLLKLDELAPSEAFVTSHVLRSNCPITNQPDWASLSIAYSNKKSGAGLSMSSLLRYIVSFRQHNGFHEQTVEQIFADLHGLGLERLLVCAQYTRRGGIDINPIRTTGGITFFVGRVNRQ